MYEKHGKIKTPEYRAWFQMKDRCFNRNNKRYLDWGGRGICVCTRWKNSFIHFLTDLGERPSNEYSLDRIDNDKNYSCGQCNECVSNGWVLNCKWSTRSEQGNNRRRDPNKLWSTNTSGYKGVSYEKARSKYKALIYVNGCQKYLGLRDTPEEAHQLYLKALKEIKDIN